MSPITEKGFGFLPMIKVGGVPLDVSVTGKQKNDKILVLCEEESDFILKTLIPKMISDMKLNQFKVEELSENPVLFLPVI